MEEGGHGFLPSCGCDATEPHNDEEGAEGGVEGCRHDAYEFVGNTIRAGRFVVSKFAEDRVESELPEDIGEESGVGSKCVLGRGFQDEWVKVGVHEGVWGRGVYRGIRSPKGGEGVMGTGQHVLGVRMSGFGCGVMNGCNGG